MARPTTSPSLVGQVFGRLTVIELTVAVAGAKTFYKCKCSCGNEKKVRRDSLLSKRFPTKSCGCLTREVVSANETKHGWSRTTTYKSWQHMTDRCVNIKSIQYKDYGGRGITVCERWKDFLLFLEDMGERPPYLYLERKNNNLGYSKENCKWADRIEQCNNRRSNHNITINNETKSLTSWAREQGLNPKVVSAKILSGQEPKQVLQIQ